MPGTAHYSKGMDRLQIAARVVEFELRRKCHNHLSLYKAGRDLRIELNRYLDRRSAMVACGVPPEAMHSTENNDLVRECHVMIECVNLLVHE
jgi:hypothetical protein